VKRSRAKWATTYVARRYGKVAVLFGGAAIVTGYALGGPNVGLAFGLVVALFIALIASPSLIKHFYKDSKQVLEHKAEMKAEHERRKADPVHGSVSIAHDQAGPGGLSEVESHEGRLSETSGKRPPDRT
jgi:hypothetical protein